ncbi:uncharacterized protein LOC127734079 isoform X2 [Mytilus californianus]|uniref:uncharacterized protein LOC127734079 isoform X2 n=1 Tax=Mytilus californianus TaxID=6549 RepID=UPI0022468506|nr:uncharacterized protein LOC127734079 isoform X2 [Mytilus californianus]
MLMNVLIFVLTFVFGVEGLCFYPCRRQELGKYIKLNDPGRNRVSQFNCKHPTLVVSPETGETRECFALNGPFIVQRLQGQRLMFRCLKDMTIDPSSQIVVLYAKPFRTYSKTPTLCEVCGAPDRWLLSMLAAQGVSRQRALRVKAPPIGCNVPKDCQIKNPYTDLPCNGCEPKEDDGLCCRGCKIPRNQHYA